jgi:hypothetical protein
MDESVSPNPAGLLVMLIVSQILYLMIHRKSSILKYLRQIVTCGILWAWMTVVAHLSYIDI